MIRSGVAANATVYIPGGTGWGNTRRDLEARLAAAASLVRVEPLGRGGLMSKFKRPDKSFLFLYWALWAHDTDAGVIPVEQPPCATDLDSCEPELDPTVPLRVADVDALRYYAPPMFNVIRKFAPGPRAVREILEAVDPDTDIEEAACAWVPKNEATFSSWNSVPKQNYTVVIVYCERDPALEKYERIRRILKNEFIEITNRSRFPIEIQLRTTEVDCSDADHLKTIINDLRRLHWWHRLVGCVVGGEGAALGAKVAKDLGLYLVLYDAPTAETLAPAATGSVAQLALAVRRFCTENSWSRLAVLSEPTRRAEALVEELRRDPRLALRDVTLPSHGNGSAVKCALAELQSVNARVILVNAEAGAVAAALAAARELAMTPADGYVWIAREWFEGSVAGMTHFTISFGPRSAEDAPSAEGRADLREKLDRELGKGLWPPRAVPLVDATLALVNGFLRVLEMNPGVLFDLHSFG